MLAFLDYDGTLTTHECNEIVLQRFVGDAWRPLEAEAQADRMSHAEVFDRQIGLIRAPREELIGALVAEAEPAPGLAAFLAELDARGGRVVIVSAGLREAIAAVWRREDLPPVELHASELVGGGPQGGPPYRLAFSGVLGDCPRCGPGACKGAALRSMRRPGEPVLVFGDGASDLCPAREADLTFARGHLAARCAEEGLVWRPLVDFASVWADIDAWAAWRATLLPHAENQWTTV
jgi:2-hydroxy-3-keto-5-methylthiopentenyl-1-phosphate phosphatase